MQFDSERMTKDLDRIVNIPRCAYFCNKTFAKAVCIVYVYIYLLEVFLASLPPPVDLWNNTETSLGMCVKVGKLCHSAC